jgi:hypothetical protein
MLNHLKRSLYAAGVVLVLCQAAPALGAATPRHGAAHAGSNGGHRRHPRSRTKHKPGTYVVRGSSHGAAVATAVLMGDTAVEWQYDSLAPGRAEAFRLRAAGSGLATAIHVYISANSSARTLAAGLYSSAGGRPGTLLSTGAATAPQPGAWTTVAIAPVELSRGGTYWLAILGGGGRLRYRDRAQGPCPSETSAARNLLALPSAWRTGTTYADCPASMYVTPASPPVAGAAAFAAGLPAEQALLEAPAGLAAPASSGPPIVSGSPVEGQTLSTSAGSWSGDPTAFAYQWEDCNTSGEACSNIAGATASSYRLAAADVGHRLRAAVTATNTAGSAKASSEATGTVAAEKAPTNTALPSITGAAEEGATLTASEGSWTGSPTGYAYQWEDCNTSGEACSNISKATASTHKLGAGDVGHDLRVVVSATNAAGTTKATSEATGTVVAEKAPENKGLPSITGDAEEGETLSASEGSWSGNPTSFGYVWEDCEASGEGCSSNGSTSSSYKLRAGDVGHTLRVIVTATNGAGSGEATSEATSTVVAAGTPGGQVYVSQTGAGAQNGTGSCANAHSLAWLNEEAHWGSGKAVAPGTTVELCGTFTEPVETKGSGTSGKPVTILFTAGAKIAMSGAGCPGSGCINVGGGSEYITIDGGTDGQIENTERGYAREKDEGPVTTGIEANGCSHCRFENLEIGPMYIAEKGDVVGNTEIRGIKIRPEGGHTEYITVANDYLHDMGWAVNIEADETTNHIYVEHNTFYHLTHGFTPGGSFNGGDIGPVVFAYNHFYGDGNWEDGDNDTNHVDGVHCFAGYGDYPHYNDEPGKGLYIYDNYITTEGHNVTAPVFLEGSNNHTVCGDKTSDMWVFNNVLTGTSCCGLLTGDSGEEHVYNNTLIGATTAEEGCEAVNSDTEDGRELADQDYRFKNDVVTTCRTLMDAEKQLLAPNGLGYNLWANAGSANEALVCRTPEYHGYYFSEFSAWKSCLEQGEEHSITAGSAKLNLTEVIGSLGKPEGGSEAIGHGENLSSLCSETPEEALCKNIDGEARPTTGAWDIGAY